MKTLLIAILAVSALGGCAVYPAYGPSGGVYLAPAPVVVYPSYGYGYGHGPRYGGRGYYGGYGGRGYYGGYGYRGWR